jgi:hypothetical protein
MDRQIGVLFLALSLCAAEPAWAQCTADVNGDGAILPNDFAAWIQAFNARAPLADQNLDGLVMNDDFSSWIQNYNAGCRLPDVVNLTLGGGVDPGLVSSFSRGVVARSPDGTDSPPDAPRFGETILDLPLARLAPTFTNVGLGSAHLGFGYAEDGTFVQFNSIQSTGGTFKAIQATHGLDVAGDPGQPTPANARRYAVRVDSTPSLDDWTGGLEPGDSFDPQAGAYFRGAWMVISQVSRTDRTGVAISVGNYTPAGGLAGNGGAGAMLDTVFCDVDMHVNGNNRVREWSSNVFILRDENEAWFTAIDYSGANDNESWAIVIRATRGGPAEPWTFGAPTVVLELADNDIVDHFHHCGLARSSITGKVTAFVSTGDAGNDQAMYVRTIADPDQTEAYAGSYTYAGRPMAIAFAEPPAARWSALDGWTPPQGVIAWGAKRNIFGRRTEDGPGNSTAWPAPQYVGCAPGPRRSQLLLGGDVVHGNAIVCYDVDTFDPETETRYPEVWQRWSVTSQHGFLSNQVGLNVFRLVTGRPEAPRWYAADFSVTNYAGVFTPTAIMLGAVTDDGRVLFGKVVHAVPSLTLAITEDGREVFLGAPDGRFAPLARLSFLTAPELVRPRLLGAGYAQYQPLFAAGASALPPEEQAGPNQFKSLATAGLEQRPGITSRYALDSDLARLDQLGFPLPGLGPAYFVSTDGTETDAFYLSRPGFSTLGICDTFPNASGNPFNAAVPSIYGASELMLAVLNDPDQTPPRTLPLRLSFGDGDATNPGVPGRDYTHIPLEGSAWQYLRITRSENDIDRQRLRISSTSGNGQLPGPGDVPQSFYAQVVAASAGSAQSYPIGYAGPPNAAATAPGGVIDTPRILPDEVQAIGGLGPSGTVVYHTVNDPHGVDREYYLERIGQSPLIEHALFSIVQDSENYVEIGWQNGEYLYAKVRATGRAESVHRYFQAYYLQRNDDFRLAVRYDASGIELDAWHNGLRFQVLGISSVPQFTSPAVLLGSRGAGQTIPVQALSLGVYDQKLTLPQLIRELETGRATGLAP